MQRFKSQYSVIKPVFSVFLLAMLLVGPVRSLERLNSFILDPSVGDVVGQLQQVTVSDQETLIDIGREHMFGYDAVRAANPDIDAWAPEEGAVVTLPAQHVLPAAPRKGIVINVSEKRLYYYPPPARGQPQTVEVYAISVGRGDWSTPLEVTKVTGRVKDPAWYPPASVRAEHAAPFWLRCWTLVTRLFFSSIAQNNALKH